MGFKQAFIKIFDGNIIHYVDLMFTIAIVILVALVVSKLLSFFVGH